MKIALVPNFNVEYSIGLANGLARLGEVAIFARGDLLSSHRHALDSRVRCWIYGQEGNGHRRPVVAMARLARAIREYAPSVVHIQNAYTWFAPFVPLLSGFPLILTVHDPKPHEGLEQPHGWPVTAYSLAFADRVIVHGERLRADILGRFRIPPDRVRVVPHGEIIGYDDAPISSEPGHTVLFFGRIHSYKGLDQLVRAAPAVVRSIPDVRFVVAGAGDTSGMPELHAPPFELRNYYVPKEEVSQLFGRASVVVLPYVEGSQSGVLLMAYRFGRPVVATKTGSIPELVEEGKTGLLVPPRNPEALARALTTVLNDDNGRRAMGEAALAKLRTELNWDTIASKTIAIYEELL